MKTEYLSKDDIRRAADLILAGELVAFQTETVYGLGADATNSEAVEKIFKAKGRPADNPLIVHVDSIDMAESLASQIPEKAKILMDKFWPGPLTIILPVEEGLISEKVTGGLKTVGLRLPASKTAQALIHEVGRPIAAPSANTSGKPSPTQADHVWHDLKGKIAAIIDDGPTGVGLESTVIEIKDDQVLLYRPGGISQSDLEKIVGSVNLATSIDQAEQPKSPGLKYRHYAPDKPVKIFLADDEKLDKKIAQAHSQGHELGLLVSDETLGKIKISVKDHYSLGKERDIKIASQQLFAGLRFLEEAEVTLILAESMADLTGSEAYMNRLEKAAAGQYI